MLVVEPGLESPLGANQPFALHYIVQFSYNHCICSHLFANKLYTNLSYKIEK